MNNLAIISVLFNYSKLYQPLYFSKLKKECNEKNFYTVRHCDEDYGIKDETYYFKFTFYRIRKFVKYLNENILPNHEYFLLTDATDVTYNSNFSQWKSILEYYRTEVLFGAEKFLWPETEYSYLYPSKNIPTEFKYLNAGVILANTKIYVDLLEKVIQRNLVGLCDQGNWQIEYLTGEYIEIDYESRLVLNTFNASNCFDIRDNKVIFKKQEPLFLHDNGGYNENTIKLDTYFR